VGLERGPLSFVSTTQELRGSKNSGSGQESREYCHSTPIRKSWHQLRRQAAVARSAWFAGRLRPRSSFCLLFLKNIFVTGYGLG
jgi:hypothetical protein